MALGVNQMLCAGQSSSAGQLHQLDFSERCESPLSVGEAGVLMSSTHRVKVRALCLWTLTYF